MRACSPLPENLIDIYVKRDYHRSRVSEKLRTQVEHANLTTLSDPELIRTSTSALSKVRLSRIGNDPIRRYSDDRVMHGIFIPPPSLEERYDLRVKITEIRSGPCSFA